MAVAPKPGGRPVSGAGVAVSMRAVGSAVGAAVQVMGEFEAVAGVGCGAVESVSAAVASTAIVAVANAVEVAGRGWIRVGLGRGVVAWMEGVADSGAAVVADGRDSICAVDAIVAVACASGVEDGASGPVVAKGVRVWIGASVSVTWGRLKLQAQQQSARMKEAMLLPESKSCSKRGNARQRGSGLRPSVHPSHWGKASASMAAVQDFELRIAVSGDNCSPMAASMRGQETR